MAKFQVWLIHRGTPNTQQDLPAYYERQMHDPFLLGLGHSWWQKIWKRLLLWWRQKDFPQLPQDCSNDPAERQARELERILGTDYQCRTVYHYNGTSAEERLKALPQQTQVLLLVLEPFHSSLSDSMLTISRQQLEKRGQSFSVTPLLSQFENYRHAYLEAIRRTVLEKEISAGTYAIVLLIPKDARNWKSAELALEKAVFGFLHQIAEQLDASVPIYHAVNHPSALEKLTLPDNCTNILYGFPSWVCTSMQNKPASLEARGYQLHEIPPLNQQPSFIRLLAEMVWEHTDNHPSQTAS